jgi:chemotaxis protein methyltransferase CheR
VRGSLPARPGPSGGGTGITDAEFLRFRDFFYRHTGIFFAENKRYYVDKRIEDRIAATDSPSFQSYFALLRAGQGGEEMKQLVSRFTVNETYFYREEHQFRCMSTSLLPAILAGRRRDRPIRIWSVPCSTGEEPYSIAMWLLENWPEVDRYDVEITGSDIDTDALRIAQAGTCGPRALMRLPSAVKARYFEQLAGGHWRLVHALRDSVQFTHVNLVDATQTAAYRGFDIVFCRNLLIYFDDASRRLAVENIYDCLAPGGFVCLGHSESMSRISPLFEVRRFPDAIVYQKPEQTGGEGA